MTMERRIKDGLSLVLIFAAARSVEAAHGFMRMLLSISPSG